MPVAHSKILASGQLLAIRAATGLKLINNESQSVLGFTKLVAGKV